MVDDLAELSGFIFAKTKSVFEFSDALDQLVVDIEKNDGRCHRCST